MTGGISGFKNHGETHHPDYVLQVSKTKRVLFKEKNYFCPLDGQWYTCLKWLSRAITKAGWSNEQYYLTYGEQYLPSKWAENSSNPVFGHRHCSNTCLLCSKSVKFNERHWAYPKFCDSKCSTAWYANNTNRVAEAKQTLKKRKAEDSTYGLVPTQLKYWIVKHNLSEQEAHDRLRNRQSTGTLGAYINRAGGNVDEGTNRFSERQLKWQHSLAKSGMKSGSSKISQQLFESIQTTMPKIKFGLNEVAVKLKSSSCRVDCILEDKKRVIEFYGDYWHGNPRIFGPTDKVAIRQLAKDKWAADNQKNAELFDAGFEVMIIWESDYIENPDQTIDLCLRFLNG